MIALAVSSTLWVGVAEAAILPPQCPNVNANCAMVSGIWAGYGTSGVGSTATGPINILNASWVMPNDTTLYPSSLNFTCPLPPYPSSNPAGLAVELFGAGLNRIGSHSYVYGFGTLGYCAFAQPYYYAWYDLGGAPVLIPTSVVSVAPGQQFWGSIYCIASTCNLILVNGATSQSYSTSVAAPTTINYAECFVSTGKMFGLNWPLPPSVNFPHDTYFPFCYAGDSATGVGFTVGGAPHQPFDNEKFRIGSPSTVPTPLLGTPAHWFAIS